MTKEFLKKHLPVMQAWVDGKTVQCRVGTEGWSSILEPSWHPDTEYRIKPEPREFLAVLYAQEGLVGGLFDSPNALERAGNDLDKAIRVREVLE